MMKLIKTPKKEVVMKQLWEIIREKRESLGITQKELSERIGCSSAYISHIEQPYSKKQKLPADNLLRKIAKALTTSKSERQRFEILLLVERAKMIVAPEVAKMLEKQVDIDQLSSMPDEFIKRLKVDIENNKTDLNSLSGQVGIKKELLKDILEGKGELKQNDVIVLAKALNQNIEEYLLLAGIIPKNVKDLLTHKGLLNLLLSIADLSQVDMEGIIKMLNAIINIYKDMKRKRRRGNAK